MNRNLKMLGLALLAAFAFGAIVAQGALAVEEEHQFETTGEETTALTGQQGAGENQHKFTINEVVVTCHGAVFSGTQSGESGDHISVAPKYSECHSSAESSTGSATIVTNNCTFTYDSETDEEGQATIGLVCPEGKDVTFNIIGCIIHVAFFTKRGITYTNLTNHGSGRKDALAISATVTPIEATSTGGFVCGLLGLGFSHTTHSVTFTGTLILTGYEDESTAEEGEEHEYTEGAQTNIRVEGAPDAPEA